MPGITDRQEGLEVDRLKTAIDQAASALGIPLIDIPHTPYKPKARLMKFRGMADKAEEIARVMPEIAANIEKLIGQVTDRDERVAALEAEVERLEAEAERPGASGMDARSQGDDGKPESNRATKSGRKRGR